MLSVFQLRPTHAQLGSLVNQGVRTVRNVFSDESPHPSAPRPGPAAGPASPPPSVPPSSSGPTAELLAPGGELAAPFAVGNGGGYIGVSPLEVLSSPYFEEPLQHLPQLNEELEAAGGSLSASLEAVRLYSQGNCSYLSPQQRCCLYGTYCGAGCGMEGTPPKSPVDACCQAHDACYESKYASRTPFDIVVNGVGQGYCDCDQQLIACVENPANRNAAPYTAATIEGVFRLRMKDAHACGS